MAAKVTSLALRVIIAAVFIVAGAMKIYDFKRGGSATSLFYQDIANYQLGPDDVAQFTASWAPWLGAAYVKVMSGVEWSDVVIVIAIYLPWLEVIAGLALLGPWLRLGALTLCGAMTLVFLGALSSAWARGLDISCGCFGRETNATDFPSVIGRDLALLAAIGVAFWLEARRERLKAAAGEAAAA